MKTIFFILRAVIFLAVVGAGIILMFAPPKEGAELVQNILNSVQTLSLWSSGPSEGSVCNAIKSTRVGDDKYGGEVVGCRKINGREANVFGQQSYVMEPEITTYWPRGFYPECINSSKGFYTCWFASVDNIGSIGSFVRPGRFVNPGERVTKKIEASFRKTERGWQGQDGKLH